MGLRFYFSGGFLCICLLLCVKPMFLGLFRCVRFLFPGFLLCTDFFCPRSFFAFIFQLLLLLRQQLFVLSRHEKLRVGRFDFLGKFFSSLSRTSGALPRSGKSNSSSTSSSIREVAKYQHQCRSLMIRRKCVHFETTTTTQGTIRKKSYSITDGFNSSCIGDNGRKVRSGDSKKLCTLRDHKLYTFCHFLHFPF